MITPYAPPDTLAEQIAGPILKAEARVIALLARDLRADDIDRAVRNLVGARQILSDALGLRAITESLVVTGEVVREQTARNFSRGLARQIGHAVAIPQPPSRVVLTGWVSDNVQRISSLRDSAASRVERALLHARSHGLSAETLAAQWERQGLPVEFGTLRGRAIVIARDQLGKLAAQVNETQQRQIGVTSYTWRTRGDSRVRHRHAARDGQTYAWNSDGLKPGDDVLCRCVAIPVISAQQLSAALAVAA